MQNKLSIAALSFTCLTLQACGASASRNVELSASSLRQSAQAALSQAVAKSRAKGGFVVIADVKTGAVLETVTSGIDRVPAQMDPGSLLKPLVLAVALENRAVIADEILECGAGKSDWDNHPRLSALETVAMSSNRCSARMIERMGPTKVTSALRALGVVLVPTAAADHTTFEEDWLGAADGCASPSELVSAYAVIANRGEQSGRRLLREDSAAAVTRALSLAVSKGTGRAAHSSRVAVAGKTATVLGANPKCTSGRATASFLGFFPAEHPRWVVLASVVEPQGPFPLGGRYAAPLFREVVEGAAERK